MKGLLKFITCGSVDDGKSTLIGHMLYDAKLLFSDHEKALVLDSKLGNRNGKLDYSLLLDGLIAEREQGITIDVAYRFFSTGSRSFIVADCPGHEQYTHNMAVGASFADLAVVLTDATKGLLTQTRRHVRICSIMGIKHFILAVNKIDLVSYDELIFYGIREEFLGLMSGLDVESVYVLPVCATNGDNVTTLSKHTPWHKGLPFLSYLEQIETKSKCTEDGFIMPVQRVCRPNYTYRGFEGQIEHGQISVGDEILVLPEYERACVRTVYVIGQMANRAFAGQAVSIQLDREVDVSRGSVLTSTTELEVSNTFTATVVWMDSEELNQGRQYWLKCGTKTLPVTVIAIKHKIDINSGKHMVADKLYKNEIAVCNISLSESMVFDSFDNSRTLGGFILINRFSNVTSACGTIQHSLRSSTNIVWTDTDITSEMRADIKAQKPITIWFTGLSGAGKTVLANALEKRLFARGKHTMLLDGDNIRYGLNKNLDFKESDRVENIRRIAEVAKLMNDAGLIVLVSLISPYESDRENARDIIGDSFKLVYVSTPLEICESRDVKGLYAKARRGEITNFTGISDVYNEPAHAEITIDTSDCAIDEAVEVLLRRFFKIC